MPTGESLRAPIRGTTELIPGPRGYSWILWSLLGLVLRLGLGLGLDLGLHFLGVFFTENNVYGKIFPAAGSRNKWIKLPFTGTLYTAVIHTAVQDLVVA